MPAPFTETAGTLENPMRKPIIRWLAVMLAFTFLAASCGGESSSDDDAAGDDADVTDSTDPEETDPEESDTDETDTDGTDTDDTADAESGEPNIYDDPRDGIFDEF